MVDVRALSNKSNSGYKVVVAATDASGQVKNYESDSLSSLSGVALSDFRSAPIAVDVYVDTLNPENYYVDIDDLPELTSDKIKDLIKTAGDNSNSDQTGHIKN